MNPQNYLNSFINFESHLHKIPSRAFNLDRVRRLLSALGDPQSRLKCVHVAGTKGKGSTCAFIAYILRYAGYRVGLYTSPNLFRVNERVRVLEPDRKDPEGDLGGSISDGELTVLLKKLRPILEKFRCDPVNGNLTYFEVLTVIALYYFAQKKADIVVLETGLGGRLDATNVVGALVNVITPIGFDHMRLLGNTLTQIAKEKAAIIKFSFSKVVISPQDPDAMKVILDRCRRYKIQPVVIGKNVKCFQSGHRKRRSSFHVRTQHREYKKIESHLIGKHQVQNAAAAVAVIELLTEFGFAITSKDISCGIRQARWPGRFEILSKKPAVIVDCAHNEDSVKALVRTFRDVFPGKKAVLILGVSTDKDIDGICRALNPIAQAVILTRADHPRAHVFHKDQAQKLFKRKIVLDLPDVKTAVRRALVLAGTAQPVLAAGSVFLAAQVRSEVKDVSI